MRAGPAAGRLALALLACRLSLLVSGQAPPADRPLDQNLLLAFKTSVSNWDDFVSANNISGWGDPTVPFCLWTGVVCNARGRLTSLIWQCPDCQVPANATLPDDLARISSLTTLNIQYEDLHGTLPPAWGAPGAFPSLLNLVLRMTELTGSIPPEWGAPGALPSLVLLSLADMPLSGPLPDPMMLPSLLILRIFNTDIDGMLPATWGSSGSLPNLRVMALQNNSLVGHLPESWAQPEVFPKIEEMYFGSNELTGGLPPWHLAGSSPNLRTLDLSDNPLKGGLPAEYFNTPGSFPALQMLVLSNTSLSGTLPDLPTDSSNGGRRLRAASNNASAGLANLISLWVDGNDLSGTIPATWAQLPSLRQVFVKPGNDRLCGSAPPGATFKLCDARGDPACGILAALDSSAFCQAKSEAEPSAAATASPASAAPPPPPADSQGGISAGAIAGAAVGGAVGLLTAVALVGLLRRRRKLRQQPQKHSSSLNGSGKDVMPNVIEQSSLPPSQPPGPSAQDPELGLTDISPFAALMHAVNPGDESSDLSLVFPGEAPCPAAAATPAAKPGTASSMGLSKGTGVAASAATAAAGTPSSSHHPSRQPSRRLSSAGSSLGSWLSRMFRLGSLPQALVGAEDEANKATAAAKQGSTALPLHTSSPLERSSPVHSVQPSAPPTAISTRPASIPITASPPTGPGSSTAERAGSVELTSVRLSGRGAEQEEGSHHSQSDKRASNESQRSLHSELSDWEIRPEEIEICQRPDGSPWELGVGGFGQVYKAMRNQAQPVAVKVLTGGGSEVRQMSESDFHREIAILRACRDPNIVLFLGACLTDDNSMLVTEYCEGGNLTRNLVAGRITWYQRGRKVALDVAKGLVFLHSRRIVHFDLKSPNILLGRDGTAKIADVGMARIIAAGFSGVSGQIGTLAWAAPELLLGARCTEKADIYSFGVLLWEICTGQTPVRGQLRDVRVPEECPREVRQLILSCLSTNPRKRPTAMQLVETLRMMPAMPRPASEQQLQMQQRQRQQQQQTEEGVLVAVRSSAPPTPVFGRGRWGQQQPAGPLERGGAAPGSGLSAVQRLQQRMLEHGQELQQAQQAGRDQEGEAGTSQPVPRPRSEPALEGGSAPAQAEPPSAQHQLSRRSASGGSSRIGRRRSRAQGGASPRRQAGLRGALKRSESIANFEALAQENARTHLSMGEEQLPHLMYASINLGEIGRDALRRAWAEPRAQPMHSLQRHASLDAHAVAHVAASRAAASSQPVLSAARSGQTQAVEAPQTPAFYAPLASSANSPVQLAAQAAMSVAFEPGTPLASPFAAAEQQQADGGNQTAVLGLSSFEQEYGPLSSSAGSSTDQGSHQQRQHQMSALSSPPSSQVVRISRERPSGGPTTPHPLNINVTGREASARSVERATGDAEVEHGRAAAAHAPQEGSSHLDSSAANTPSQAGSEAAYSPSHGAATLSRCFASALGRPPRPPGSPGSVSRLPPLHEQFFL